MADDNIPALNDPDNQEPKRNNGNAAPPKGAYILGVANGKGELIDTSTTEHPGLAPNPEHPDALAIHFELLNPHQPVPPEQGALRSYIERVVSLCRERYLNVKSAQPAKFRNIFIRLFHLAQRGLEGDDPRPDIATAELLEIAVDLDTAADKDAQTHPATPMAQISAQSEGMPAGPAPRGAYTIWVADTDGNLINPPRDNNKALPDPNDPNAVNLYFGLREVPPKDQFTLYVEIGKVLRACQRLYLEPGAKPLPKFRIYFARLFHIAQLGLEGEHPLPDAAAVELASIASDLLDDEGARIKNGYLLKLGVFACVSSGIAGDLSAAALVARGPCGLVSATPGHRSGPVVVLHAVVDRLFRRRLALVWHSQDKIFTDGSDPQR